MICSIQDILKAQTWFPPRLPSQFGIVKKIMYSRLLAAAVSAAVVQSFLPAFSSDTHQEMWTLDSICTRGSKRITLQRVGWLILSVGTHSFGCIKGLDKKSTPTQTLQTFCMIHFDQLYQQCCTEGGPAIKTTDFSWDGGNSAGPLQPANFAASIWPRTELCHQGTFFLPSIGCADRQS